jgi:DNA-binding transcriptional LysR family regulator
MLFITRMNLAAVDLNLFLVLHAVLGEASATRAAKRLGVTQSAVSNALGRLRALLGDPLVVRRGRGLVPTPRGLELAPIVAAAVAQLETAVSRGSFVPAECVRRFTIALADNHQASDSAQIAAAFATRLPRAILRVVSADYLASSDGLASGEIDVALVPAMLVQPPYRGAHVFDEHACLVVARDHRSFRGGKKLTPRVFAELGHIDVEVALGKTGVGHRAAADHWKAMGLERRVAVVVPFFATAALIASCTELVAGLPSRAAAVLCKAFGTKLVPATFALPSIGVSMMWHERTDADPGARFFRELVATATRDRRAG